MARESLSRGDLLLLIAVLAIFGIADAAYLTLEYYQAANSTICDFTSYFSCSKVRDSPFSAVAGVPTATVGLAGFVVLLLLAILAFRGTDRLGPWPVDRWILVFAGLGALIGLGLTFLEIFVIQAVCLLCAIGFAVDLGILAVAWRLNRATSGGPAEVAA